MNYFNKNNVNFFVIALILLIGSFIAITRASNFSDGDSYSILLPFLNYFDEGIYNPSRGAYGHPIPELIIGFIAFLFGTPYSNLFCFLCFFLSNIILFKTFINKKEYLYLYLLIVFSNFNLLFDNTNSIDYPIALLFFSLGVFFLKKNYFFYSSIFFALCIASSANFSIFIYPIIFIFFVEEIFKGNFKNFLLIIFITTAIGLIFYFPVFKTNNYTLNLLEIPFITDSNLGEGWYGGPPLKFEYLAPRFFYKIYQLIGVFSIFIFIFNFKKFLNYFFSLNKANLILSSTIFINLFIYFLMPTKFLLINPFLLFLYIVSFTEFKKKILFLIIIFNLLQWIISYEVLNIKHKYDNICAPVVAVSANVDFSIKFGNLVEYFLHKKDYAECYSGAMGKYSYEFKNGLPLRLAH